MNLLQTREFVLATTNQHKLEEIRKMLPDGFIIKTLTDIGFSDEIEETGTTFRENALIKARRVFEYSSQPSIADDSGLEVDALNGEPGVYIQGNCTKAGYQLLHRHDPYQEYLRKITG